MSAIILRALEPEDLNFLYQIENDMSLWHLSNTQQAFSADLLKRYIAEADRDIYEAKQYRFTIEIVDNQQIVGFVDLFDFDPKNRRAGIGIIIHREQQGKGYGTEALQEVIRYAFNILYLHQLYANISAGNLTSLQLFEKQGFVLSGNKKEWNFDGKQYEDELLYQLINRNK